MQFSLAALVLLAVGASAQVAFLSILPLLTWFSRPSSTNQIPVHRSRPLRYLLPIRSTRQDDHTHHTVHVRGNSMPIIDRQQHRHQRYKPKCEHRLPSTSFLHWCSKSRRWVGRSCRRCGRCCFRSVGAAGLSLTNVEWK